jgi:ATP-binding cassette subfamily B protein
MVGVLAGTAWRAAPGTLVVAFVMATAGALASSTYPVGYHLLVDGALAHDGTQVTVGVGIVVVLFTLTWTVAMLSASRNILLTDRLNAFLGQRIAVLVNAAPRLEHFERSDLLTEIDQLRDNRRALAGASRQLLTGWQVVIRGGAIMVLLATVYPPVMVIPLIGVVPALADRRASRIQKRAGDALAPDRRLVGELFGLATNASSAKELRTYGITGALTARHAALAEQVRRQAIRSTLRSAAWEAAGWAAYAGAFVAVIVVLVLRAAHGDTSPGQVVMAVSLMRRAQVQVSSATDTAGTLATAFRTARRLLWLEDYVAAETAVDADRTAEPPVRLREGITLDKVTFAYPGADEPVLHELDLRLPAGAVVAIVGENGAGKTTLAKLLTGMYRPTAGTIQVDGVDLDAVPPAAWRTRTTAAFQDYLRPNLLARQAVGVGDLPRSGDDAAVGTAVERAGATAVVEKLPHGLDTPLGRWFSGGHDLSGGGWQRLALARGMMRDAPLLTLLDEPTASLDAVAESRLFQRFAEMSRAGAATGGITVLISHRFSTVGMADLIVVLEGGRLVEYGSHEELMARGGGYAQMFALQARAYTG